MKEELQKPDGEARRFSGSSSSPHQSLLRACMSLRNSRQLAARLSDFEGRAAESSEEVTE